MKKINFSSDWKILKENIILPHDAMLGAERHPDAASKAGGAYFEGGIYHYKKIFEVPENWRTKNVAIYFEGIYRNSKVLLNGIEVGGCRYGYTDFSVPLNENLVYGKKNILEVIADNSQTPNSRWYTGGGIYRPVWLLLGEEAHIKWQGVKITTKAIAPAVVEVKTEHTGEKVLVEILKDEQVIATAEGDICNITVPNARLWSDKEPNLYQCRVSLYNKGELVETVQEAFGIRQITYSNQGLFINGERTFLKGGCVHHDNGILGACSFAKSEWRRVKRLKDAGFNAIRSAHNPCSIEMLKACDYYGMYVMDELWDMWYKPKNKNDYGNDFMECYLYDIDAMVAKDYNHPSVIMYSIGNEVVEPAREKGLEVAKKIVERIKALDETRPTTGGFNLAMMQGEAMGKLDAFTGENGEEPEKVDTTRVQDAEVSNGSQKFNNMMNGVAGKMMNLGSRLSMVDKTTSPVLAVVDIAGYNYGSGRYTMEKKAHPERVVVGSETFPGDIAKNWRLVEKLPYLIGDFMWTAWDYLGEAGIGAWSYYKENSIGAEKPYPWLLADAGAFDILGNPNGEAFLASAVWDALENPMIAVRPVNRAGEVPKTSMWRSTNSIPSWSWKGCVGKEAVVEVYYKAHSIVLELNGKRIGKKRIKNCMAKFKTKYAEGTLTAIAYDKTGKELGRNLLSTAQNESLKIVAEETHVKVGDIVYVNIAIADAQGNVESNADRRVECTVVGGRLLGFGSANPRTEESFLTGSYSTYYGHAQAIILAEHVGTVSVTVKDEFGSAATEILVEE